MRKLALFVVLLLALGACRTQRDTNGREGAGTGRADAPPEPAICPLTGLPAEARVDVDRPALSVKIENAPVARPQSGLEDADIVYEQLAEGGITRFNAIYHCSDAAELGPVRSARNVDPDVLAEYAPVLFAYAGAARPVEEKVEATEGITNLSHGSHGDAYARVRGRRAPHNLFSSTERLRGLPDARAVRGSPEIGLEFEKRTQSPGSTATSPPAAGGTSSPGGGTPPPAGGGREISFSFGGRTPSRYTYDPASGKYLRFHGPQAHRSAAGEQIAATNVIVLKVQVRPGSIRDAAGNLSPEITVVGSGEAFVLSGGRAVSGRWNRSQLSEKTRISDASGATIKLAPGTSWIHLVPVNQPVTVSA